MQIRIKNDFQESTIQFLRGQKVDVPDAAAKEFIAAGNAVAVPAKAEFATSPKAGR